MRLTSPIFLALAVMRIAGICLLPAGMGFTAPRVTWQAQRLYSVAGDDVQVDSGSASNPVLNGKRVLPYVVMKNGLKGSKVMGVYAILNSSYKRGEDGWECCEELAVSEDILGDITMYHEQNGKEKAAHVRALSFQIPSRGAMEEVAADWEKQVRQAAGPHAVRRAMESAIPYDDEDDEDEFDDDFTASVMGPSASAGSEKMSSDSEAADVVSPFSMESVVQTTSETDLEFTRDNVDKVLDEIRPYLISDGGNVSVERIDEEKRDVYLVLEGACGSCASSTITMQMGIERVLKENFKNMGQVLQVEDEDDKPTALSFEAIEKEVNRLKPAIIAMGGNVEVLSVDTTGDVRIKFRGANKVRQGLELALRDVEFVKNVEIVMGED